MLSAYRRSTVGVVLTVNNSLKPRLFSTGVTLSSEAAHLDDAAVNPAVGRERFITRRVHSKLDKPDRFSPDKPDKFSSDTGFMPTFKTSLPKRYELPFMTTFPLSMLNRTVRAGFWVSGFLGAQRKVGALLFVPLTVKGTTVQLVCSKHEQPEAFAALLAIAPNSAVRISGRVQDKVPKILKGGEASASVSPPEEFEVAVTDVECLAKFPADIIVGEAAKYGPEQRHLQLRFDADLAQRILFRSRMTKTVHNLLADFTHVDTPILFKSTPEGAREFLVPTRTAGMAYALPQSPQQYKQILMASGIHKYYQMAHCFRDEDLRADRQPEFMQLDLEMAFSRGCDVRVRVEALVRRLWTAASTDRYGRQMKIQPLGHFPCMTYSAAMADYGVDKPDTRIKDLITDVSAGVPESLRKMFTSITNPVIETFKFRLSASPDEVRAFVAEIMDSAEFRPFHSNPDGPPGVFIYDPSKPLQGLQAFGHEHVNHIETVFREIEQKKRSLAPLPDSLYNSHGKEILDTHLLGSPRVAAEPTLATLATMQYRLQNFKRARAASPLAHEQLPQAVQDLEEAMTAHSTDFEVFAPGDLIIMQARANEPFSGGSTAAGRLRTLIHRAAVEKGYMSMPAGFEPLWVIDFPLFTPNNDVDPGQGGSAGFSATHHPFTAPKMPRDVDLCRDDPRAAIADHYDLVINGVELGGGSARIHNAEMQEYVLRDVLGMKPERVEDFRHLLEALRAGCPPHAGLALGWDRLIALMCGRESIRDVVAFPKDGRGRDVQVGAPSRMTEAQQKTYHLTVDKE